jgi:hypothetical protein
MRKYKGIIVSALVSIITLLIINAYKHSLHGLQMSVLMNVIVIALVFGSLIKSLAGEVNPILTGAAVYSCIVLVYWIGSIIGADNAMSFKDYVVSWLELAAIGALSGFAFKVAER